MTTGPNLPGLVPVAIITASVSYLLLLVPITFFVFCCHPFSVDFLRRIVTAICFLIKTCDSEILINTSEVLKEKTRRVYYVK